MHTLGPLPILMSARTGSHRSSQWCMKNSPIRALKNYGRSNADFQFRLSNVEKRTSAPAGTLTSYLRLSFQPALTSPTVKGIRKEPGEQR
jgi:hypothetical protein